MARLIVSAIARNFSTQLVIEVSVSGQDGKPTKKLKAQNFTIHQLSTGVAGVGGVPPSLAFARPVIGVDEDPNGFYTLVLEEINLAPGHYVFAVAVTQPGRGGVITNHGQVIAAGNLPPV